MRKYFLFDCETTGLLGTELLNDDLQPDIIEFFGHIVDETGHVYQELDFLCKPRKSIDDKITKITGITNAMLEDELPFVHYNKLVRDIIAEADAVVAHNLSFDLAMVNMEMRRCGHADDVKWPIIRICTVEQTEWKHGHRLNLNAMHELLFGEGFTGAHRARDDVQALTRCFLKLLNDGDL